MRAGPSGQAPFEVLLQARALEEAAAIRRANAYAHGPAVAHELDRNFPSRRPAAPNLAIEIGQAFDLRPADGREHVAAAHPCRGGGSLLGYARHDELLVALREINADPRARR